MKKLEINFGSALMLIALLVQVIATVVFVLKQYDCAINNLSLIVGTGSFLGFAIAYTIMEIFKRKTIQSGLRLLIGLTGVLLLIALFFVAGENTMKILSLFGTLLGGVFVFSK